MKPGLAVIVIWLAFGVSWVAAMAWSSRVAKEAVASRALPYRIVLLLGSAISLIPAHGYRGPLRWWFLPYQIVWPTIALIVLGLAFSWWARIWLGPLWSGRVTTKADHRVVATGPYAIVRHPIYTGILFAVYATAALKGTVLGLAGAVIITLGLWMKARLEESWLRAELGAENYDAYRRRVPMLLPLGPRSV